jgi:hypothetical protein
LISGTIDAASYSEPIGLSRLRQSKPIRGMPMPPSLR